MPTNNIDLIRGIYDAFSNGDVATVMGSLSPGVIWNEAENNPWADGNPYIGPEAVASGIFARCAGEWEGFAVEVVELLDAGDTVIMLGRYRGTYKATGRSQNTQVVHVWRIDGGRVSRFQQYVDTLQLSLVMGKQ
ncbi:MAG: nuclear transport factor 2 family protein [Phycisphaerales bacterium]|nr:nuclear transport factor 2 family protein [Phycisphaerales bacterium]